MEALRVRRSVGAWLLMPLLGVFAAMGAAGLAAMVWQRDPIAVVPGSLFLAAGGGLALLARHRLWLEDGVLNFRLWRTRRVPLEDLAEFVGPPSQEFGHNLWPMRIGFLALWMVGRRGPVVLHTAFQLEGDLVALRGALAEAAKANRAAGLLVPPVTQLRPSAGALGIMGFGGAAAAAGGVALVMGGEWLGFLILGISVLLAGLTWRDWAGGAATVAGGGLTWRDAAARTHSVPLRQIREVGAGGKVQLHSGMTLRIATGFAPPGDAQRFMDHLAQAVAQRQ